MEDKPKFAAKYGKVTYSDEYVYDVYCSKVKPRLDDVKRMFFEGYSFTDVAKELDVSNSLLWKMRRNSKPQYAELRVAFEFSDVQVHNVENSLYRRAVGFYYDEDREVVLTKEYYNKKGKKCKEQSVKVITVRRYVPSDVNAIKFFLVNKNAKNYSNEGSQEQSQTDQIVENLKNVFIEVKRKADSEGER